MGKKKEEIKGLLEDVLTGKLLQEKTDEIIGLFPGLDQESDDRVEEDLVIWAKSQEMAMEEEVLNLFSHLLKMEKDIKKLIKMILKTKLKEDTSKKPWCLR